MSNSKQAYPISGYTLIPEDTSSNYYNALGVDMTEHISVLPENPQATSTPQSQITSSPEITHEEHIFLKNKSKKHSMKNQPPTTSSSDASSFKVTTTHVFEDLLPKNFFYHAFTTIRDAKFSFKLFYRAAFCYLSIIILIVLGLLWNWKTNVDHSFVTVDALDLHSQSIRNRAGQAGDQTFLIVGVDSRAGANSKLGAGDLSEVDGARSDTIILVDVPANRQRVIAVSFPRDLEVTRPDCKQWDNDSGTYSDTIVPGEDHSKINAAYAFGGPKCLVSIIQDLSGIEINHFVGIDFSGFEHLVNDVGGVKICNTEPLVDEELGTILHRTGKHTIYGRTALNYVRARMVAAESNGDYGRIKRQQHFISSLLRGMLSAKVLTNPRRLNALIRDFTRVTFVQNITSATLLDLAQSVKEINAGHISMLTVPTIGTSTDGKNNEVPNTEEMNALFDAIINDNLLPGEPGYQSVPTTTVHSPATKDTTTSLTSAKQKPLDDYTFFIEEADSTPIRIFNAGNAAGKATTITQSLSALGYNTVDPMDAPTSLRHTVVRYSPDKKDTAASIAAFFPYASIQPYTKGENKIDVMLGKDVRRLHTIHHTIGTSATVHQLPAINPPLPPDISFTNGADDSCL